MRSVVIGKYEASFSLVFDDDDAKKNSLFYSDISDCDWKMLALTLSQLMPSFALLYNAKIGETI